MQTKTKDVNIRIDRKTYKNLKVGAAKLGMTLKAYVEYLYESR